MRAPRTVRGSMAQRKPTQRYCGIAAIDTGTNLRSALDNSQLHVTQQRASLRL